MSLSANLKLLKDKQDELAKIYQEIYVNIKEIVKNDIQPSLEQNYKEDIEQIKLYKGAVQAKGYLAKLCVTMKKSAAGGIYYYSRNVPENGILVVEIMYGKDDYAKSNEIYNQITQIYNKQK